MCVLRKSSEAKAEAFFTCLEPAIHDFIQREIIERFQKKRKDPLFLAYGDFPGSDQFKQLLWEYLEMGLDAMSVSNVDCCRTIDQYINDRIRKYPEMYHNKIVWFDIKEMNPKVTNVNPDHFSAIQSHNFHTWYKLETLKDDTIGIVVTYHCKTDALFGLNSHWDKFYDIDRLWKVHQSPLDFAAMIADDCRNLLENTGIKPVQKYYQKFQKKVLAFANMEIKRRQKTSREHQWGISYERQYPYNQDNPENAVNAFLKLVDSVNKEYGIHVEADSAGKENGQSLTELIQKAANQQKVYQNAVIAEAKAHKDPDYYKYISMHKLTSELNEAFHEAGGTDYDGDDIKIINI